MKPENVEKLEKAASIDFIIRTGGIFIQERKPLNFFYRMEVKSERIGTIKIDTTSDD
jgi:hypothetical protein